MTVIASNMDALLVGIPMIGLLFVGYFRLDELVSKPKRKRDRHMRPLATIDASGKPVCLDPDELATLPGAKSRIRRHRVSR